MTDINNKLPNDEYAKKINLSDSLNKSRERIINETKLTEQSVNNSAMLLDSTYNYIQLLESMQQEHLKKGKEQYNSIKNQNDILSADIQVKNEKFLKLEKELEINANIKKQLIDEFNALCYQKKELNDNIINKRNESGKILEQNMKMAAQNSKINKQLHKEFCLFSNILKFRIIEHNDYLIKGYLINTTLNIIKPITIIMTCIISNKGFN